VCSDGAADHAIFEHDSSSGSSRRSSHSSGGGGGDQQTPKGNMLYIFKKSPPFTDHLKSKVAIRIISSRDRKVLPSNGGE